MANIMSLPDDILILVCQNVELLDLLALRLTSRRISRLVLSHSNSIAPCVAQITFHKAQHLLRVAEGKRRDFTWLKSLVNKYLAAILVDRFKSSSERWFFEPRYIPTESEIGDGLRKKVENGLVILKRLSDISKEVYALPNKELMSMSTSMSTSTSTSTSTSIKQRIRTVFLHDGKGGGTHDLMKCREQSVLDRRLQYLKTLSRSDLEDFRITTALLAAAFKTKHDQPSAILLSTHRRDYQGPDDFDWNTKQSIMIENGNSWVNWVILHEGPIYFFRQWIHLTSVPATCSVVKQWLLEMSERYTNDEKTIQQTCVRELQDAIKAWSMLELLKKGYFEDETSKYVAWERGLERFHSGDPIPPSWTDEVPYFINFTAEDD